MFSRENTEKYLVGRSFEMICEFLQPFHIDRVEKTNRLILFVVNLLNRKKLQVRYLQARAEFCFFWKSTNGGVTINAK